MRRNRPALGGETRIPRRSSGIAGSRPHSVGDKRYAAATQRCLRQRPAGLVVRVMIIGRRRKNQAWLQRLQRTTQRQYSTLAADFAVRPAEEHAVGHPGTKPCHRPAQLRPAQSAEGRRRPALRAGMRRLSVGERNHRKRCARPCGTRDQKPAAERLVVGMRRHDDNPPATS